MSDASDQCPSTSELAAVLQCEASEEEIVRLMRHLDHCESCVSALDRLTGPSVAGRLGSSGHGSVRTSEPPTEVRDAAEVEYAEQEFVNRLKSSFRFATPTFIGSYKVLRKVGQGTMGEVFECEAPGSDKHVALKTIRNHVMSQSLVIRFSQEARMLEGLDHPNIVKLTQFGMTLDGMPYLAMEFVGGGTLSERLARGRFEPNDAARFILRCAEALDHAHTKGVLHRDIKPSNIMLGASDPESPLEAIPNPKLGDFGLARYFGGETHVTQSGSLVGTPGYMSPEQIHSGNRLGPESDIYGLGVVLYETMTGAAPFRAPSLAGLLRQIQDETPTLPRSIEPEIPRDLEIICLKCLEKRPEDRYLSASELAADLKRFIDREPIHARPFPWWTQTRRWCKRNSKLAASFAVSAFLMILLSISSISFGLRKEFMHRNEIAAKEAAILSELRAVALAREAHLLKIQAQKAQSEEEIAKKEVIKNLKIRTEERDLTVNLMEKATGALYGAFLETGASGFGNSPELQRLRGNIAGAFFMLASEAKKIPDFSKNKTIYLVGLLYKSAVIHWEFGARDRAIDQFREVDAIYRSLPEDTRKLDGLISQVISARKVLGMWELDRKGPDAGIAVWKSNWRDWYGRGERWLRDNPHSVRMLADQGRELVGALEHFEKWDELREIAPELKLVERIRKEQADLRQPAPDKPPAANETQ